MKTTLAIVGVLHLIIALSARADRANELIDKLTDADATVRQQAEVGLTALGEKARPAIVEASRSDVPAIASAASRVLLSLSWYKPEDPTVIKQMLADYGRSDEPGRISIASQIADAGRPGIPVLLRLVVEDPSEDVCWKIVTAFRNRRDTRTLELIRRLDPPDSRPAALVLVARAWEYKDRSKALAMLGRAVETESRRQSFDDGELDYAFDLLAKVAEGKRDYDEAARLRRLQASRIGLTRDSYPSPVFLLFAMHGNHGPLEGFDQDLATYQQYLGSPQVLYALSRANQRTGRPIEAHAYAEAAMISPFDPGDSDETSERELVIRFLSAVGWTDLARREAYAMLGNDTPESLTSRSKARLILAELAGKEEDDARAIEHLAALCTLLEQRDPQSKSTISRPFQSQIVWRKARMAQSRGDLVEANKQIDALVAMAPVEHLVLLDAYPVIKSLGRDGDGRMLFEPHYNAALQQIAENPDAPVWLNDMAWLCARCDQKLEEALEHASKAVAAEPDNAAYIDTLAEVQFRLGNAVEAVKLETRALELEPGDVFMTKQLDRFKAGPAK